MATARNRNDIHEVPLEMRDGAAQKDIEKADNLEKNDHSHIRVTLKERLSHFTWQVKYAHTQPPPHLLTAHRPWFASTMSTGALAAVLGQTPNRFPGLTTIGKIFFITDIVLFIILNIAMCARFIIAPRKVLRSLYHPIEGLFVGSYFVSIGLILNLSQSYGVPHCGPWLVKTLQILFWMYCAVVLLVAIFQYFILFQNARLKMADAMPAWIFPIYPLLIVGTLASNMIPSQPPQAGYEMWVGAVMLQGLAWTVSLLQYSIYMQRLMVSALPTPSTRPGMYVSVGPAGKRMEYKASSYVLILLQDTPPPACSVSPPQPPTSSHPTSSTSTPASPTAKSSKSSVSSPARSSCSSHFGSSPFRP